MKKLTVKQMQMIKGGDGETVYTGTGSVKESTQTSGTTTVYVSTEQE